MAGEDVRYIDVDEAKALWDRGQALFLDVRSQFEYNQAHIPGARPAPITELMRHTKDMPKNRTIIAY